jgi:hypothetical protein
MLRLPFSGCIAGALCLLLAACWLRQLRRQGLARRQCGKHLDQRGADRSQIIAVSDDWFDRPMLIPNP